MVLKRTGFVRIANVSRGSCALCLMVACALPVCPRRYLGLTGQHIGIDSFGASAPAPTLYEKFGITLQKVIDAAKAQVKK